MRKEIEPMLLKEVDKPFDSAKHLFEVKFDGLRAIITVSPKGVQIKSRNNKDLTKFFPELQSLTKLVTKKTIFDGEIVCFQDNLPNFSLVQKRIRVKSPTKINYLSSFEPAIYIVFDILDNGQDLTNMPLIKRKEILNNYPDTEVFIKIKYIFKYGKKLFKEVTKMNLEGIVAKEINSKYLINERSNSWLKIKNLKQGEFVIAGFIEKRNNFVLSLVLGEIRNKKLFYVGKVSVSKKNKVYQEIKKIPKLKKSPFQDYFESIVYLKPVLKAQVKYLEKTSNNHLRQPIFISFS